MRSRNLAKSGNLSETMHLFLDLWPHFLSASSYQYSKTTASIPEKMEQHGIHMKATGEVTIDTEYEKVKNTLNIDDWEQKRGPRPWEEVAAK